MSPQRPNSLIAPTGQYKQASMEFICLYLPFLPTERVMRTHHLSHEDKICLYLSQKGVDRLVAVSQSALTVGLTAGLSVPDARARQPQIHLFEVDRQADKHLLEHLARWAGRYTPQCGYDDARLSIWLDMTGASHLYGSLRTVLTEILAEYRKIGLTVRGAIASCYAAAWALACFHDDADNGVEAESDAGRCRTMLGQLPITALRLSNQTTSGLQHSGLRQVSDLYPLRNADLVMRFGDEVRIRRDQLLGQGAEPLQPLRPVKPMMVSRHFVEPVLGYEAFSELVMQMLADMSDTLQQAEKQARHFILGWQRSDGSLGQLDFTLSRPSNEYQILLRLCASAAENISADFGLDYCWMSAHQLADSRPITAALGTDPSQQAEQDFDYLIDALAARLGSDKVQRAIPQACWQIEQTEARCNVTELQGRDAGWQLAECTELRAPRPIRLIHPAQPIETLSMLPDHPPRQIRWRRRNWKVLRATGPERVGPTWWDNSDEPLSSDKTRDYYRLELAGGPRIWVYREGLAERGDTLRWYMQGFFA